MNNSYKFLFLVLGCLLIQLPACTNLDEEVYSSVTADNFFQTEEQLLAAFGVAYTNLYSGMGNKYGLISIQGSSTDELCTPTRGGDWADGGEWIRLHRHDFSPDDAIYRTLWNFIFGGVSTTNQLINGFETIETDLADFAISELRALRALYYLWAVDLFGNVPIVTAFDAENPPTNTRLEVYEFIEKELTEAGAKLSKEVTSATYGRVNYYVAQTILAKLYLNAEVYTGTPQWEKAAMACDSVINSGVYNLMPDFFDNFTAEPLNSSEIIMGVPYDQVNALGNNLHYMSLHYQNQNTYGFQGTPWNGFCTLQEYYEQYEENDQRINSFLAGIQYDADGNELEDELYEKFDPQNPTGPRDPDGPVLTFTPEINELEPGALRQAGARIGKYEFQTGVDSDLDTDIPIFRYSDVLLTKAEALWRQGNDAEALVLINQVRTRAGADMMNELSEESMLAERAREFFAEGHRRTDMIRFGKFNDAWWEKDPSSPHTMLFPIPTEQLQSNPNLKQNDGY